LIQLIGKYLKCCKGMPELVGIIFTFNFNN